MAPSAFNCKRSSTIPIEVRRKILSSGEIRQFVSADHRPAMQQVIKSGKPHKTLLDPPPADPHVAHDPQEVSA
jgi:hypothetical protein